MHRKICSFIAVMALVILSAGCAFGDVPIDAANFPDSSFRNYVKTWDHGWNEYAPDGSVIVVGKHDDFLNDIEIARITGITVQAQSLKGIENFHELDTLGCSGGGMKEIDLTALSKLGILWCYENELEAVDVSQNKALYLLGCHKNNIKKLDVSQNSELKHLQCHDNPLGKLDVTHNTKLEYLNCGNNDLRELDVSKNLNLIELGFWRNPIAKIDISRNTALQTIYCSDTSLDKFDASTNTALIDLDVRNCRLTELDLSNNNALTTVQCSNQQTTGLKVKAVPEGYEVCLNDYVSNIDNIDLSSIRANDHSMKLIKYRNEDGQAVVTFPEYPKKLHYNYNTHSPNNDVMDVTIKVSLNIDVIERGAGAVDNLIICGVADDHYIARGNVPVTEKKIAKYSAKQYGKKGFVADGNSRLIVRVKTERPGNVEFSVKENIGVEIERLSDRAKVSGIHTTDIGGEEHQASAVLVAPEMYLAGKFPSQDFTVHVKFTADETGEEIPEEEKEMEEDIELEIHAAPIVLIHGFSSKGTANCWNDFGFKSSNGIYNILKRAGFDVYFYDYRSNRTLMFVNDGLFYKLSEVFRFFLHDGIVCTKADIVACGMGGLIARNFCTPEQGMYDDNYYTSKSYAQGMVRRIITIATPHRGSPIASMIIGDFSFLSKGKVQLENFFLTKLGLYVDLTMAIRHLLGDVLGDVSVAEGWSYMAINSSATNTLFPVNVPMHSIYGHAKDALENIEYVMKAVNFAVKTVKIVLKGGSDSDFADWGWEAADFAYITASKWVDIPPTVTRLIQIMFMWRKRIAGWYGDNGKSNFLESATDWLGLYNELNDLLFDGNDHDLFVSVPSAQGDFFGNSTGYYNRVHTMNDNIFMKDNTLVDNILGLSLGGYGGRETAEDIAKLLKGTKASFQIFTKVRTLPSNTTAAVKTSDEPLKNDSVSYNSLLDEKIKLTITPAKIDIAEKGTVKLTARIDEPIDSNLCVVVNMNGSDRLFPLKSNDVGVSECFIEFTSKDSGLANIYCFTAGNEDNVYFSNTVQLAIKVNSNIAKLSISGKDNTNVIFTDSSSDIPAGLIAQTSDDFAFDVSSPLMGTSWTSSNPEIAYVSSDGMIHSLADGSATLTASYAGLSASIIVNVGNNFSAPEITSQSLDGGNVGKNYTAGLQASGTPIISWRIIDGRLPFDLTLSDSGIISGYPSEEGTFTFTAEASNIFGTDSQDFTITIGNAAGAALTIDANIFPDDNFRAFISDNLDWNHDGFLTEQEITGVTAIDVSNLGIKSLKGIEFFTALVYLTCTNNELTELDLSKNVNIYGVASQNNQLESINLANCSKLFQIWLDNNKLSSVDFTHCPAINILSCKNNLIKTLDLRKQANITDLQCDEGVDILYSDTPGSSEILIDANNFPDDAFRKFIADNFDWDKSSSLSNSEINAITGIEAVNMGIKSLKGIEHFTALEYLTCVDNDLEEIDLSGNPNFIGLAANNNRLQRVNVSKNPKLRQIWVNNNKLSALDFSHNPELAIIDCSKNFLTELDISANTNLRELYFVNYPDEGSEDIDYHTLQGNAIRNIDLSNAPLLTRLGCSANGIETLDISNNPLLEYIECHNNYLTQIDTSIFTELKYLHVGGNKIGTLDVSQNTKLQELFCGDNLLETLTLGDKPDLFRLHCWGNNLVSLNLTECPALAELHFSSNKISAADLTNCTELVSLDCGNNLLAELDISQNTKLQRIACDNNSLGNVDFSHCPELVQIFFSYNKADRIDLTKNPKLKTAYFLGNMLTEIDFSGNPELEEIGIHENKLTRLDVSQLTKLRELHCGDNLLETLTLGDKPALLRLYCYRNNLTELKLIGCPALKELSFGGNKISAFDIANCKELESLAFWDNFVTELDISEHVKLKDCIFGNNRVKTLTVGNKTELLRLHCYSNDLSAVNITGCPALTDFNCEGNKISVLDVTQCKVLEILYCRDNLIKVLDLSECPKITALTVDEGVKLIYSHEGTEPEILTETLMNAVTGREYSYQLSASGAAPLTWTRKGNLPAGLELSESGLISGTPKKAGKSSFTVTASNTYGESSRRFTLLVLDPVSITTTSLKAGTIGKSYSVTMRAKGSRIITWSAEGLPAGLTINEKGKISGKPTVYGKFTVKITAQNGAGSIAENLQLEIKAIAPKLSGSLARPTLNEEYSSALKVTGSDPIIWSIAGTLPEGLTFDTSTGKISGTPTSYAKSGYKLTITATNDGGSKSKKITLKVNGKAPKITAKLPGATAGENYSAEITASGSEPITFAADLPEFLSLNGNIIAGVVPESAKSFRIKIYASNPVRQNVNRTFTIKVSKKKSLPENINAEKYIDDSETYNRIDDKSLNPENVNNAPGIPETGEQRFSGYMIVAELGEISCDMAEMYNFEIQLPDYVSEGSELFYIANSDSPSEDDEIAEFYDDTGKEITAVPENGRITISIWLNPEILYNPVIAVKY